MLYAPSRPMQPVFSDPGPAADEGGLLEQPLLQRQGSHEDEGDHRRRVISYPGPFNLHAFLRYIFSCWSHALGEYRYHVPTSMIAAQPLCQPCALQVLSLLASASELTPNCH